MQSGIHAGDSCSEATIVNTLERLPSDRLAERLLDFAAAIAALVERLPHTCVGDHIARQLIRCGMSPAPNDQETWPAESQRAYSIGTLAVALREVRETRMWLRCIAKTGLLPAGEVRSLVDEGGQLGAILGKSIAGNRNNNHENSRLE